jgi:hypothetical protein
MSIERLLKSNIQVVEYTPLFQAQAVEIAHEMHAHSTYSHMPLDEAKVIRQLAASGTPLVPDRYFRLAVRNGELLGGFYGIVRRTFFNDEVTAHDLGWWVKGTARGSKAAILLLADFARWAQSCGAQVCMVGQSTGIDIARTARLYEHVGFKIVGFNAAKRLHGEVTHG